MIGQQERKRRQWFHRIRTIEHDWMFYTLAFIPFFIITFAVWICLDEAIFALRYRIVIQWSLFPYFRVFPDLWHYFGILLFISGMILTGFTLLLNRSPQTESSNRSDRIPWFQIFKQFRHWLNQKPVLVILGLIGLINLGVAIAFMNYAFTSQLGCSAVGPGIPCFASPIGIITIESLYLHQLGDVLVAVGLIFIFILIIRERSED